MSNINDKATVSLFVNGEQAQQAMDRLRQEADNLRQSLQAALAAGDDPHASRVVSSQEILLDLADMADISLNDLAATMARLGYTAARRDGKVGWLIKAK